MKILLLGSGGRECAIAKKLSESSLCSSLFIAPGNGGTGRYGTNVSLSVMDFPAIADFCVREEINILFPASEDPLVAGIYDYFKSNDATKNTVVVGPTKSGARLEGSKAFSKQFMQRHNIPTAAYAEFTEENFEDGLRYLDAHTLPIVLKADGLAAGKGVVITEDKEEARTVFADMIRNAQFGEAGKKVVVEQFLTGVELSVFAFTDGKSYVLLPEAKDYKRILEGDKGPNTGGMGAVSPVPFAQGAFMQMVEERIVRPTVSGLAAEGILYQGFIFFGLINVGGEPYVIEYNCRMGDPETEVVMPRLENDLVDMIIKMRDEQVSSIKIEHSPKAAATVMLVSKGYPEAYEKGKQISGADSVADSIVFHAGTVAKDGNVLSNGGRVMAITSLADSLPEALHKSYASAEKISFEGMTFRTDIGYEFV